LAKSLPMRRAKGMEPDRKPINDQKRTSNMNSSSGWENNYELKHNWAVRIRPN
jgi:hypothetical protein